MIQEIEPVPLTEEQQEAKDQLFRENKLRVQFTKPTAKHIVSPHSGSILSEPNPEPPLEEAMIEKATNAFNVLATDNLVESSAIVELLVNCGFDHDVTILAQVVKEFYTEEEPLSLTKFLEFLRKFYAPAYYYGQRLRRNVGRGQNSEVTSLLVRNCDANTSDGEGTSSLHYCCEYNRPDIIEILVNIAKKGLALNAQDRYGWTPLHSAVHQGNQECVAWLLKLGAKVNMVNSVGKSPLHTAAAQNRSAIADMLLQAKANVNLQDAAGMTPLHEAAYRGQFALYNDLCKHPTAQTDIKDILGYLPSDYLD
jgi:hypothetical protein